MLWGFHVNCVPRYALPMAVPAVAAFGVSINIPLVVLVSLTGAREKDRRMLPTAAIVALALATVAWLLASPMVIRPLRYLLVTRRFSPRAVPPQIPFGKSPSLADSS